MKKTTFGRARLTSHIVLAVMTLAGCGLAYIYEPDAQIFDILSIGTGYVAFAFLAATLLIGPLNLIRKRKNPVNIYLRRDVGIWCGFTAIAHVLFSFQIFEPGKWLNYFFNEKNGGLRSDDFGISNNFGAIATLIMLILLVTSNDICLRWMKGKRWKLLQRTNYALVVLVAIHTLLFQNFNARSEYFVWAVVAVNAVVLVGQIAGIVVYRRRAQKRAVQHASPTPVAATAMLAPMPQAQPVGWSRRQFLITGGAAIVAGVVTATVVKAKLTSEVQAGTVTLNPDPTTAAIAPTATTAPTATATAPAAQAPTGRGGGRRGTGNTGTGNAPTNPGTGSTGSNPGTGNIPANPGTGSTNTAPATPTPAPTTGNTGTATGNSGTSTSTGGTVLAALASLPIGKTLTFTTPDTKESCILIHEADGSVKAFSNVCTHAPYEVVYDESAKRLVCHLHNAYFDANSGAVTKGPARRALKSFKVAVDGKGNIVYSQA